MFCTKSVDSILEFHKNKNVLLCNSSSTDLYCVFVLFRRYEKKLGFEDFWKTDSKRFK